MGNRPPDRVSVARTEKTYHLAALLGCNQPSVFDAAADEYSARHAAKIEAGLYLAREALLRGQASEIAYLLNADPEAVDRVSGARSGYGQGSTPATDAARNIRRCRR